jgi:hypothetical protein
MAEGFETADAGDSVYFRGGVYMPKRKQLEEQVFA